MKVINNQDKVAQKINELKLEGVEAVGDDGSVCIQVSGNESRVKEVASIINEKFGNLSIGDGVQEGDLFINADDCNIHEELGDLL